FDPLERLEHRAITLHRDEAIAAWAWAIPSDEAIAAIGAFAEGKVVEMGAGKGYWAWLLEQAGLEVHAYDHEVPPATYTRVHVGQPAVLNAYDGAWTLLLCWPPYQDPMAVDALDAFRGHRVVYIGEGDGGCTGDNTFHRRLRRGWTEVEVIDLPQWEGIHDRVRCYTRGKKTSRRKR
ncbi:MAG TPA: hypothetical protein VFP27_17915, partial [Mycobacterium sp.]|nr:hypothetical protein [Mycobacterium sp.]